MDLAMVGLVMEDLIPIRVDPDDNTPKTGAEDQTARRRPGAEDQTARKRHPRRAP